MRITSGIHRGRILKVPAGDAVRPTQDRVREALFSMLMHDINGASFLDLFAGAGSVGLEALSRGASRVTFVEAESRHAACVSSNVAMVKEVARCEVIRADAYRWVESAGVQRNFDIVFADPPYALVAENGYENLMTTLANGNVVRPGGLFIGEMRYRQDAMELPGWDLCRDRTYGQTRIVVYRRHAAE